MYLSVSVLFQTIVSSAYFLTLEDALANVHGVKLDVFAVAASVGPLTASFGNTFRSREICLKDSRFAFGEVFITNYITYCKHIIP